MLCCGGGGGGIACEWALCLGDGCGLTIAMRQQEKIMQKCSFPLPSPSLSYNVASVAG